MWHWRFAALSAAAMGFVVAACGDGNETKEATSSASASSGQGGGGQGGGGTIYDGMTVTKEFCGAVAAPFCGALFACCSAVVVLDAYGGTVDTCTEMLSANCMGDTAPKVEGSIAAGHTILDTAQLD